MTVLFEVGVLVLFATLAGVLANRFRIPPVLGLLLIGALVGPNFFGLVSESETVDLFSHVGAVLLLFAIGLEFSISKISKFGIRILAVAVLKLAIVFFLSFQLASLLGFGKFGALYVGAILAITSTALMVKIVEQKNYLKREEVRVLIASLVIEDLFAVFALAVFSGIDTGFVDAASLASSIEFSLLLLLVCYLVVSRVLAWVLDYFVKYRAAETMTLLALGIGVGFSYLAESIGLTPSIGAFLAGSMVASLKHGELLKKSISHFILAFSSIFFLSIGMLVNLSSVFENAWIIVVLLLANLVFKFAGSFSSMFLFGFTRNQAVFSGIAMLSVGEFSLLIAQQGSGVVGFDLLGITTAIVFFSALASALWLGRFEGFSAFLGRVTPLPVRAAALNVSRVFSRATASIDSAGKSAFSAVKQNAVYWFFGVFLLVLGWASSLLLPWPGLAGFGVREAEALARGTVFCFAVVFALGVQKSVVSLSIQPTPSVKKLSHMISLTAFLLLLPFVSSAFDISFGESEVLFLFVGALILYVLYYPLKRLSKRQ